MECRPRRTECAAELVGRSGLARICGRATRDCEEISMPFALIPTALGVCFCLVWVFIGGMILRDSQLAAQQDLDSDIGIVRLPTRARRRGAA